MRLPDTEVFKGFCCYKIYHKKMGRWQVCLWNKQTGKRRTILYAKYLVSLKEGRILTAEEQVDHIDGDKENDDISNLEIVTEEENRKRYNSKLTKACVTLTCPYCGQQFTRERRQTHLVKGGTRTFCSRSCVAKSQKRRNM